MFLEYKTNLMKLRILIITITTLHLNIHAQTFNRPVPPPLFPYEFISNGEISGYILTSPFKLGVGPLHPQYKSPCPTILDSNGYVFWYVDNNAFNNGDFKYYPEDSTFSFTRNAMGTAYYHILDRHLNMITTFGNVNGIDSDNHDCQQLENGNYIIGGQKDSVMDLSTYTFDGTPGSANTVVTSNFLQEFDENFNLVFQWNSLDHIHPTECIDSIYGYNALGFDYCHFNAVEQDADGNLLISFRHLDAIYKIDHSTGNVMWILGGRSNQFTFTNDNGFSGQHDIRKLANGNISLFDNANSSPSPKQSRGVEYSLDTASMTVTKTWEYLYSPPFFARAMGNHTATGNQEHLINYGLINRPHPNMVITDNAGNIIKEMIYADSVMNYRVHIANIPFDFEQPEISCYNNGSGILLTAPAGYSTYVWSTGETTQSIMVNTPDTYQVWFNYGIGMLGSKPFMVTDVNTDCVTGVENEWDAAGNMLSGYYDLMGRKIEYLIPGGVYIHIQQNGKRVMYIQPK